MNRSYSLVAGSTVHASAAIRLVRLLFAIALVAIVAPAVAAPAVATAAPSGALDVGSGGYISGVGGPGLFPLVAGGKAATLVVDSSDVFNRGSTPFAYSITAAQPWLHVTPDQGTVDKQTRATVSVDWQHAPKGTTTIPITVSGPNGASVVVQAVVDNPTGSVHGFVEANGYVAMNADHYSRAVGANGVSWLRIPGIGRTGAGMEPAPITAPPVALSANSPHLEYAMTLSTAGPVKLWANLSPRNDVLAHDGLKYAISIDGETPQVVNIMQQTGSSDATMNRQWERNTSDNVNRAVTTHLIDKPGAHTLKFWMIDPTVIAQSFVIDAGGVEDSYLGPPESVRE